MTSKKSWSIAATMTTTNRAVMILGKASTSVNILEPVDRSEQLNLQCSSFVGIDRNLSARIEREEKGGIATSAVATSHSINSLNSTGRSSLMILAVRLHLDVLDKKFDNPKYSDNEDDELDDDEDSRKKKAKLAAQAAERRLSGTNIIKPPATLHDVNNHSICAFYSLDHVLLRTITW